MTSSYPTSEFYLQVKQESTVFANVMFILEKLENESHMAALTATLKSILEFEINFAQSELKKIRGSYLNFDFNAQLIQNTVIFKENLKLISNSLGRLTSRRHLVQRHQKGRPPARPRGLPQGPAGSPQAAVRRHQGAQRGGLFPLAEPQQHGRDVHRNQPRQPRHRPL